MSKAIFRDKDRCINCYACIVACKLKHNFPPYPTSPPVAEPKGQNLITLYKYGPEICGDRVVHYFLPISCMHCTDAPCIKACPRAAIYKDLDTNATLVNQDRCIGCRFCLWVCPYGAPRFTSEGKIALCDMCIDRLRQDKKAACEAACVARAIFIGTTDEIAALQAAKIVKKLD